MTPDERLTEVFDRGFHNGQESLSAAEADLYRIQHFILEYDMGGIGGYLYNNLLDRTEMQLTIDAMKSNGLHILATLVRQSVDLFSACEDLEEATTWGEICQKYDPSNLMNEIDRQIAQLDNFGLDASTIE